MVWLLFLFIAHPPPLKVAWIKADAKAILAIHEHVITNNDRLSVTHSDQNTWTLVIKSVKMEDRGQYMCQVNTDPMKMQVIRQRGGGTGSKKERTSDGDRT